MIEALLQPRVLESKDWATVLFILSFGLIAIVKTAYETRFNDFLKILFSDKYIKIYKDPSYLMSGFTILLFIVQTISLSFFIQLFLAQLGYLSKTYWVVFIRIFTFLNIFILSKFLIEKIIATVFNIEEFVEQFNLQKVSHRTFISLLIIPFNIFFFYNDNYTISVFYALGFIIIAINLYNYLISLKVYQNILLGRLFYFILYLCTLEIAPYYFMYYLITKNLAH